jgi:hypothetical protein
LEIILTSLCCCFHAKDIQYNVVFGPEPGNTPKDHQDAETSKQPAQGLVAFSVTIFFSSMLSWGVTPLQGFLALAIQSH